MTKEEVQSSEIFRKNMKIFKNEFWIHNKENAFNI